MKITATQKLQDSSSDLQVAKTSIPTITRTDSALHSTETTIVPMAGENNGESPAFPLIFVLVGIGGIVIAVIGILLVRRWWIRRQNPALFRKYD